MTVTKINNNEYIYFAVQGNNHSNTAIYQMTTSGTTLTKNKNVYFGSANTLTFNPDIAASNGGVIVSGHAGNECCPDEDNGQELTGSISAQCTTDASQYSCTNVTGFAFYNDAYNQKGIISYISTTNTTPFTKIRTYYPEIIQHTLQTTNKSNEAIFTAIAYDKDNKLYYVKRGNYLWMLNSIENNLSYNKENNKSYQLENIANTNVKDWAYYKGLLYLTIYGGKNTNIIMVYNLTGKLQNVYRFPDESLNKDLQISGIDFDESGNMYLSFNNLTDKRYIEFYKVTNITSGKEDYLTFDNTLNIENNIIKYISTNTSFDTLVDKIDTNTNYQMLDKNNTRKLRSSTLTTGDKLKYNINNIETIKTISVTGDVTGRGSIDNEDVLATYNILRQKLTTGSLEETEYTIAADTIKDGEININDLVKLYYYTRNKINSLD